MKMASTRPRALAAAVLAVALAALGAGGLTAPVQAASDASVTVSKSVKRTHVVDGQDETVDTRTVKVRVAQTTDLRDRQGVQISWTGAHPTGGLVADTNSSDAARQEYPVVILQCRGLDGDKVPAARRLSPETCFTQTASERIQTSSSFAFPPYLIDRYASASERENQVGVPAPFPTSCSGTDAYVAHWVHFTSVSGKDYPYGPSGCAGLPPEALNIEGSQPGNGTYGQTGRDGSGEATFVMQTAETNASLGCSASVDCSLVIIPIMGISCDSSTLGDVDDDTRAVVDDMCQAKGRAQPGDSAGSTDLTVTGQLWWSASNWRNRISVPLGFAQAGNVCSVLNTQKPIYLYGSESLAQATQQWVPHFCLNKDLFNVQHVRTSEPQAKNLVQQGSIEAALQSVPPDTGYTKPVVQAPVAVSGFVVAYAVDGKNRRTVPQIRLDARLLAKLISESYLGNSGIGKGYPEIADNPNSIAEDPEFQALNPGLPTTGFNSEVAASMLMLSSDSDVVHSLTSYLDADPVARAWLDGKADPWGMVVNPSYKGIKLPVTNWPLLDTYVPKDIYDNNPCLAGTPTPWFPQIAAPVNAMATITLNMQFGVSNVQLNCRNPGLPSQRIGPVGRQSPGFRFLFGLTSLGDAERFGLNSASLESQSTVLGTKKVTDASGRTFVRPTPASLRAAADLLQHDQRRNTYVVDYDKLRSAAAGKQAYPGIQLISLVVPTTGLPKADAAKYAAFIRYVVGPGQRPGLANGELAAGFLPLTAANGLGDLQQFSETAADAVEAQTGQTVDVSDPSQPTFPTGSGSGSGGSGSVPPPASGSGSTPSPSTSPTPTSQAGGPVAVVLTAGTTVPATAYILPIFLIAGLGIALAAVAVWGFREWRATRGPA